MENISKILLYLMACSIQNTKPEEKVLVGADLEKLLQTAKSTFCFCNGLYGFGTNGYISQCRGKYTAEMD